MDFKLKEKSALPTTIPSVAKTASTLLDIESNA